MLPPAVLEWCDARTRIVTGRPWRSIVAEAASLRADILVVGAHGREGAGTVAFGSTAQMVVRHAPCAVMTVRHDDDVRRHGAFANVSAAAAR